MKETGYITLWGVNFIFFLEGDSFIIVPKDKDDIKTINSHFDDQEFIIKYHGTVGCSTAFIQRVQYENSNTIKLFPKYIVDRCHTDSFSGFEIMGEAIDDFFSPSRYFYDRSKAASKTHTDFIYHSEIADKWTVVFENKIITVTLSYGDILRWGIASDLMLHPKLTVDFEKTTDVQYIFRVYSFIVRFLKIIRYDTKCGRLRIDLFNKEQNKSSYNGQLYDFCMEQKQFCSANREVEYGVQKSPQCTRVHGDLLPP